MAEKGNRGFCSCPTFHNFLLLFLLCPSTFGAETGTGTRSSVNNLNDLDSRLQNAPTFKFEIPALGRSAIIGELYDQASESFLGVPIFKNELPPNFISTVEIPWTNSEYTLASTLDEKRNLLKLSVDLTASIFFGLVKIHGSAEYLNEKVTNSRAVSMYMNYETRIVKESIQPLYQNVQNYILKQHLQGLNATHIVIGIEYGGSAVVKFEEKVTWTTSKESASGSLGVVMKALMGLFGGKGDASLSYGQVRDLNTTNLSIKLFGDVIHNTQQPMTFTEVYAFISKIPGQIQKLNKGKGKPITYTLFPLDIIRKHLDLNNNNNPPTLDSVVNLDSAVLQQLLQIAERITLTQQKIGDLIQDLNQNKVCIQNSPLQMADKLQADFENRVYKFKSRVKQLMLAIRSGQRSDQRVDELEVVQTEFLSGPLSPDGVMDQIYSDSVSPFSSSLEKIRLCKTLMTEGPSNDPDHNSVEYLPSSSALRNFHLKNAGKHVYVLFYSMEMLNSDEELWNGQSSRFFKLAQNPGNRMAVMDCEFPSAECPSQNINKVTLRHYKDGRLLQSKSESVSESEPETKNSPKPTVTQIPALGTSQPLGTLYNEIQGSFNGLSIFNDEKEGTQHTSVVLTEPATNLDQHILFPRSFFQDRLKALKVPLEKRLHLLTQGTSGSPFFPMSGTLRWFLADHEVNFGLDSESSTLSEFSSLVSHISLVKDSLNISSNIFLNNLNLDKAVSSGATHYVQAIYFGLTAIFQIPTNLNGNQDEIKTSLDSIRTIFTTVFSPEIGKSQNLTLNSNSNSNSTNVEVEIDPEKQLEKLKLHSNYEINFLTDFEGSPEKKFGPGDVKSEMIASLKELRTSLGQSNQGKSTPVAYILAPLSSLEPEQDKNENQGTKSKHRLIFLNHFAEIQNTENELMKFYENMKRRQTCEAPAVSSEIKSFSRTFDQRKNQWLDRLKSAFTSSNLKSKEEIDRNFQELSERVQSKLSSFSVIQELKHLLWEKYSSQMIKMDLCLTAKEEGIIYLGMRESDFVGSAFTSQQNKTNQESDSNSNSEERNDFTYLLFFREKWIRDSPKKWFRALYIFFTELNVPKSQNQSNSLYLVDCDSTSHSIRDLCDLLEKQEVTIQEYRNGLLIKTMDILNVDKKMEMKNEEKGQGGKRNNTAGAGVNSNSISTGLQLEKIEKQIFCVEKKLGEVKRWLRGNFTSTLTKTQDLVENHCRANVLDSPYFGFSWQPIQRLDSSCSAV